MRHSAYVSLGVLSGLGIRKIIINDQYESENLNTIRKLELGILGIASGQYLISLSFNYRRLQKWRYVDWIVTTPMLLKTFHLLAVEKGYKESFAPAFTANILMIVAGYLSEYPELTPRVNKWTWYSISFGAMIFVLYNVRKWDHFLKSKGFDTGRLPFYFYVGWTAYAFNFITPDENIRQNLFNILDIITKGIYSLELDFILKKNFKELK